MSRLREANYSLSPTVRAEGISRIQKAAKMATDEEIKGRRIVQGDPFAGLSISALKQLGIQILNAKNIWEAYGLLAKPATQGGESYYDRLFGPQHERGRDVLKGVFAAYEPTMVEQGLDLGAGTGKSTEVLAAKCRTVTAIDAVPEMLSIADARLAKLAEQRAALGNPLSYSVAQGDATKLEHVPDGVFDIVMEAGIRPYIGPDEERTYYGEIFRVLKPGGRFYAYYADEQQPPVYQINARARLAGEIVTATLALSLITEHEMRATDPPSAADIGFDQVQSGVIQITQNAAIRAGIKVPNEFVARWVKPDRPQSNETFDTPRRG
ncbi:MAG: class I SAM-dependent methyltransferase [Patescibacteria group bacterium]|nr:class I SAM-dependent methyltransferase [Patescibacteria group bacterium]